MQKVKWILCVGIWIIIGISTFINMGEREYGVVDSWIVNSINYENSQMLYPMDEVMFKISDQCQDIVGFEVAFSFDESMADSIQVELSIDDGNQLIYQEDTEINVYQNRAFFLFNIPRQEKVIEEYNIYIKNIGNDESQGFSLFYTSNSINFQDKMSFYQHNQQEEDGQLISRITYHIGYDWYQILAQIYLSIVVASLLSSLILYHIKRRENA